MKTDFGYEESQDGDFDSECCGNCRSSGARNDFTGTPCSYCFRHSTHICKTNGTCPDFSRIPRLKVDVEALKSELHYGTGHNCGSESRKIAQAVIDIITRDPWRSIEFFGDSDSGDVEWERLEGKRSKDTP